MRDQVKTSIVRILEAERGFPLGAGFLVSPKHVITCAHVVADALSFPRETQEMPTSKVHLDFPLAAPRRSLIAKVICWHPVQQDRAATSENGEDIAVLELEEALPNSINPATLLVIMDDIQGHTFCAYGFPDKQDNGIWIDGKLQGSLANGWVQIKDVNVPGFFVEPGFSGTPIWDDQAEGIVGIVVAAVKPLDKKTAFIIPTSTLVRVWPDLDQYITNDLKNYLEKLCKHLSELPAYYPRGFDFDRVRQRIRVSQKRLRYREEEARAREAARRAGYFEKEDGTRQKHLERAYQWRGAEMYEQLEEKESLVVDWDRIRHEVKRTVILGDPGFGKSWLLKYEGRFVAQQQLAQLQQGKREQKEIFLPILLRLGTLADELDRKGPDEQEAIVSILKREYQLPERFLGQVRHYLSSAQCLLLLDALDEVAEEHRPELLGALRRLADGTQCRILLTSRIVGYQGVPFELQGGEWERELELVSFDQEQVGSFIKNWFVRNEDRGMRLQDILRRETALRSLARIPLMLAFICLIGFEAGNIPTRRAELYETVLRRLLEGPWRVTRLQEREEGHLENKLAVLERVAWHFATHNEHWRDLLPGNELAQVIQSEDLMWELSVRDGILVKAGEPKQGMSPSKVPYLFLHRTLQEYLVAHYLASQSAEMWLKLVKSHLWFDPDWEVVIVLLAGCLDNENLLLEVLLNEPHDAFHMMLLLAGRCLGETDQKKIIKHPLAEQITRELINLLHSFSQRDRDQAVLVLGQIGELAADGLLAMLHDDESEIPYTRMSPPPLKASYSDNLMVMIYETLAIESVSPLLSDLDPRKAAAQALGQIGGPRILEGLQIALHDTNWDVRMFAVQTLGQIGGPHTRVLLRERVQDENEHVCEAAQEALRQQNKSEDESEEGAVEKGEKIGDQPIVEDLLIALGSDHYDVRKAAAEAFKQISKPAVERLLILFQDKDKKRTEQWKIAEALGIIGDLQAVEPLVAILEDRDYEGEYLRAAAARALGQIGDSRAVESLLGGLQDKDEYLRGAAAQALGQIGNLQAVEPLIAALKDTNQDVLKETIEALGKIGDPQAVEPLIGVLKGRSRRMVIRSAIEVWKQNRLRWKLRDYRTTLHNHREENKKICSEVVKALGEIGDFRAVKPLMTALIKGDWITIRSVAERALEKLIQGCDPTDRYRTTNFCKHLLAAWPWMGLKEKYRRQALLYELLLQLAPRLREATGNSWPAQRVRLMRPTNYMLNAGLKWKRFYAVGRKSALALGLALGHFLRLILRLLHILRNLNRSPRS